MSADIWKINMDLCRCCHTEGKFKNLSKPIQYLGENENYVELLKDCFDINLEPISGTLCEPTYTICEPCIIRLRDAHMFKKQVLDCEEKFIELVNTQRLALGGDTPIDICVKAEVPDALLEDNFHDDNFEDELDWKCLEGDNKPAIKKEDGGKKKIKKRKDKQKSVKSKSFKESRPKEKDESQKDEQKKKGPPREVYYTIKQNQYHCNLCNRKFASQPLISQHYRFVHLKRRPKERKCPKCDEKIPSYLRAYHLEKKHGIPAPSCGVCSKKFRFPCQVVQHQKKVHMGEKFVVCGVCDKSFFNNLSLRLHMSTHSDERRFKCETCGRQFRWENNLKDHLKIHTGDRRFVCKVCDKAFVQKSSLKQHAARNHPGVDVT